MGMESFWRVADGKIFFEPLKCDVLQFFTTRIAGDFKNKDLLNNTLKVYNIKEEQIVYGKQIHSDNIIILDKIPDKGKEYTGDGFITTLPNIGLCIFTADCLPIVMVNQDSKKRIIANIHAGRKGTEKRITQKCVYLIKEIIGEDVSKLLVLIGPHIHKCCYPVDLTEENTAQLVSSGVKRENIYIYPYCTSCKEDMFYSYRRDKNKESSNIGGMLSFVMLK
jgi:copper oxidase (laccase) domain-containing protein